MTLNGSLSKLILIFFSASALSLYYLVLRLPLYQKSLINKVEVVYIAGKHFKDWHSFMLFQCGLRSNTDMKILLGPAGMFRESGLLFYFFSIGAVAQFPFDWNRNVSSFETAISDHKTSIHSAQRERHWKPRC